MKQNTTVAIIPARMGSSRFPGKPLANIHQMPMIGHVYLRTCMCQMLTDTYVATCDQEIYDYIHSIGGKAIMTADTHERCTERTAEAMITIEKTTNNRIDYVIMVQGDEPMITPEMVENSVHAIVNTSDVNVVNSMAKLQTIEEFNDPNEVKVVTDLEENAVYFSREPIPSLKKGGNPVPMLKQVCIISFKREYLLKFNAMDETPLERIESIDMLRIIEHGDKVKMVMSDLNTYSVDTKSDLEKVTGLMKDDPLIQKYINSLMK